VSKILGIQGDLIGYQAIVRRKGFLPVRYETKESYKEAEDWAAIVEGEMVKGDFVDRSRRMRSNDIAIIDFPVSAIRRR